MNPIRLLLISLALSLTIACSDDDEAYRAELWADCSVHFRATSYKVAAETCRLAAEAEIPSAQWLLANIHDYDLTGDGADPELAMRWYFAAANNGIVAAQTVVGEAFLYAEGVEQDFEQAFYWLNLAAQSEDSDAEFAIGYMLASAKGRERDTSAAIDWFKKAADKQHLSSMNNLAWIYATSEDARYRSAEQALFWAEKLAVEAESEPSFLDTIAAAHAVAGEYERAIELQLKAISSLSEDVEEEQLLEFQRRLETYQKGEFWTEVMQ